MANGTLRAQFDANQKIELFEFVTNNHEEYLPRSRVLEAARPLHDWQKEWQKVNAPVDGKQSPEMSKKKRPMKSPPTAPPEIDIPASKVKLNMGITAAVFQYLEVSFSFECRSELILIEPYTDRAKARRSNGPNESVIQLLPSKS